MLYLTDIRNNKIYYKSTDSDEEFVKDLCDFSYTSDIIVGLRSQYGVFSYFIPDLIDVCKYLYMGISQELYNLIYPVFCDKVNIIASDLEMCLMSAYHNGYFVDFTDFSTFNWSILCPSSDLIYISATELPLLNIDTYVSMSRDCTKAIEKLDTGVYFRMSTINVKYETLCKSLIRKLGKGVYKEFLVSKTNQISLLVLSDSSFVMTSVDDFVRKIVAEQKDTIGVVKYIDNSGVSIKYETLDLLGVCYLLAYPESKKIYNLFCAASKNIVAVKDYTGYNTVKLYDTVDMFNDTFVITENNTVVNSSDVSFKDFTDLMCQYVNLEIAEILNPSV